MGAYTVDSNYTTPRSNNFIYCNTSGTNVYLNDNGDAWNFSIQVCMTSIYSDFTVAGWRSSSCTVTLYDGLNGQVIGSINKPFNQVPMTGTGNSKQLDFVIENIKGIARTIYVDINCDVSPVNDGKGIKWVKGGIYITNICQKGHFDVSDIQLTQKPVLGNLTNTNPYDNKQTISASETSISLSWSKVDGDDATKSQYQLNGQWYDCDSAYSTTISGLQPGTTYTIAISGYNEAGWSDYIYITVRTRYSPPVLSVTHNHNDDAGLEDLIFHWTSNTNIKKICYKINGSQLVNLTASGKSGQFKVNTCEVGDGIGRTGLFPNTIYVVDVYIISIDEYDHLDSNTVDLDTITDDIAHITEAPSFNLSDNTTLKKTNESGNKNEVILYINGDNDRHNSDIIMIDKDMPNETLPVDFTQEMIDTMYHQFGLKNDIASRALIKTFSIYDANRFYSANTEGRVTLTGVMKTIHSNEHYSTTSNERIYRGQIWYNPGDGPVRAVGWANVELDGKDTLLRSI